MKVRLDIDCTPEEARRFLGLPDVSALNQFFVDEAQRKMKQGLAEMDPENLMKAWLTNLTPGAAATGGAMGDWSELQKRFWSQIFGGKDGSRGAGADDEKS